MNALILVVSAALMLPAVAAQAAPSATATTSAPMSVREIVALLKARIGETVILRQIESTGTRPALSVADLLELKAAGASDTLLEALVSPAGTPTTSGPSPAASAVEHGFRVYREVTELGEQVLHVTNLDASGRRIGGEIPPTTPPDKPAPTQAPQSEPQAPVIVNIYPPGGQGEPITVVDDTSQLIGFRGWYPGLMPGWPRFTGRHPAAGSREEIFGRPPLIDTAPYRSATAAQRNRSYFGHH